MRLIVIIYVVIGILAGCTLFYKYQVRDKNRLGWVIDPTLLDNLVQKDWIDSDEHFRTIIYENAVPADRPNCEQLVLDHGERALHSQEAFVFQAYFSRIRERGKFLIVTVKSTTQQYPTNVYETCLGWEGVIVSEKEIIEAHRSSRILKSCIEGKQTLPGPCQDLRGILEIDQDIFGKFDVGGLLGSNLNLVLVDLDGREADFVGCIDLRGTLSRSPKFQLWFINTSKLTQARKSSLESAMFTAGLIRVTASPPKAKSDFDVFVLLPSVAGDSPHNRPEYTCPGFRQSCSAAEMLSFQRGESISHGLQC